MVAVPSVNQFYYQEKCFGIKTDNWFDLTKFIRRGTQLELHLGGKSILLYAT